MNRTRSSSASSSSSLLIESLWSLAEEAEQTHNNIPVAIKLLESILQSTISLLPLIEIRTRLRLSRLLLAHTHNLTHARAHLERVHLLLSRLPSLLPLKLQAHSLLSLSYHLSGSIPSQKKTLLRAFELLDAEEREENGDLGFEDLVMWRGNLEAQMGAALAVEGEYSVAVVEYEKGLEAAERVGAAEMRMFFASAALHVRLLGWEDSLAVETAARGCVEIWDSMEPDKVYVPVWLSWITAVLLP